MFRLLADEDFSGKLLAALARRRPSLDITRVQDVGLQGAVDPDVLAWAAVNDRIVLTQDKSTMPDHVRSRLLAGKPMPGVFIISDRVTFREAIDGILLVVDCSEQSEWAGQVIRLPF